MRACWLKWVGRDWSISADYIWLNYSGANTGLIASRIYKVRNAIVHSKKQTFGAFIPFKHDRALSYEIPLVKCVAEEVIDNNSSRV